MAVPFTEAIAIARACGGFTSWAHPSKPDLDAHLNTFVAAGLQGIEGLRPSTNAKDRNLFKRLARRHGLFITGGSDFHGWPGDDLGLFRLQRAQLGDFFDALLAVA